MVVFVPGRAGLPGEFGFCGVVWLVPVVALSLEAFIPPEAEPLLVAVPLEVAPRG